MSTVRLAEDPLLRRQIVVKTVAGGAEGPAARRLLREARITAALAVPGVVPVLDGGVDEEGRAWFAMPALDGESLDRLRQDGADPPLLLRHLVVAARVVARAHDVGIVHRDLKPDNVLVARSGPGEEQVYVMDWGIARPESVSSAWDAVLSAPNQTAVGQVLGTPATMSPEQVIGEALDSRSDVWALGVCLVELASGVSPFERGAATETLRAVVHAPLPTLEGPLGEVLARSLQRDPAARFPDAAAFADALEGALDAMEAPPPTPKTDVSPAPSRLLLVGVGLLGLALGGGAVWLTQDRAPSEPVDSASSGSARLGDLALRRRAIEAARRGDAATAELLAASSLQDGEDPFLRGVLASMSERPLVVDRRPLPSCADGVVSVDGRSLVCPSAEEVVVVDVLSAEVRWRKPLGLGTLGIMGSHVVGWVGGERRARMFDLETGEAADHELRSVGGERVMASHSDRYSGGVTSDSLMVYGSDGSRVKSPSVAYAAVVLPNEGVVALSKHELNLYNTDLEPLSPPRARPTISDADTPWSVAASADSRFVVEGSIGGMVRVWDLEGDGVEVVFLREGMVRDVAISSDGRWVAAVDEGGRPWLWQRGRPSGRMELPVEARRVAFPETDRLALIGDERVLWSLPTQDDPGLIVVPSGVANADWRGDWIAAGLGDGFAHRWNPQTGEHQAIQVARDNVVKDVSIGADGAVLAASINMVDPTRWLWLDRPSDPIEQGCRRVVWLEGDVGVCQGLARGPDVRGLDGRSWPTLGQTDGVILDTEPLSDRASAVMVDEFGIVYQLHTGDPPRLDRLVEVGDPGPVAMGVGEGAPVYVGRADAVELWSEEGGPPQRLESPGRVVDLALSPDGAWLAAGLGAGDVAVWSTAGGALRLVLPGHSERVSTVSFSSDSQRLLSGSWDETLRIWDLGVLERDPAELLAEAEAHWGTTAADLLEP